MTEKEQYIETLKKRALGYEYEETTTLIEETANGATKKRIIRVTKHVPADVKTAQYLLNQLNPTKQDFESILKDFDKQLKEVAKNENSKKAN